jgi:hypothetical protein
MPFPPAVKTQALADCGRCCCICHKFCGTKIECHHIVQEGDGGSNTLDNCIPVCFDCHGDMGYDDRHPKGTKYRPEELKLHRDRWFEKIRHASPADYTSEHRAVDRGLFRKIFGLLGRGAPLHFVRTHNFAAPFKLEALAPLDAFDATRSDPTWEFLDPTLESLRADLAREVHLLLTLLSIETFSTRLDNYAVPREWKDLNNGERFYEAVARIHDQASECFRAYRTFMQQARYKLAVDPSLDGEDGGPSA